MYCTSSSNMFYFLLIPFFLSFVLWYVCTFVNINVSKFLGKVFCHLKNKLSRRRKEMLGGGDLFSALSH